MNGTYLRQTGLEAPEQIGRGERHGGIIKSARKAVINEHHVIGKDQMKQDAIIAMEGTNDKMTKGGFAPSQWLWASSRGAQASFMKKMIGDNLEYWQPAWTPDCAEGVCSTRLWTTICSGDGANVETSQQEVQCRRHGDVP